MTQTKNSYQKGFSLIEVMIAVLILSAGILAVSKLQGSLIKSGADANERSVAASLVQRKADDLRRFIHITTSNAAVPNNWTDTITSPLSIAYKHIATNKGGLIAASAKTIGNIEYDLAWTVKDYYYSGTDTKATTLPSGANYPSFKMAHITAKWDSASSINNVVSFDTVIEAYDPSATSLDATSVSTGGTGPIIPYDPQQQPDVVPITLNVDGTKKETTKPLPDLSKKGFSTLVKFETVSYNNSLDTVRREEFQTLVCRCSGSSTNGTQIYGITTWDNTNEKIIDITTSRITNITKTNVDDHGGAKQNSLCFTCCKDGDTLSGDFKVCRTKRIDGVLRMFDPWKMIAFNVIPATYFNDADGKTGMTSTLQGDNINLYSNYSASLIRNVLAANANASAYSSYTTVDNTFINNTSSFTNGVIDHTSFDKNSGETIQARAIYMDYPPNGIYTQIENQTTLYTAATVPLDRIPFYEVNMTELAGWVPNPVNTSSTFADPYTSQHTNDSCSNTINCVTDEILDDAGAYSRGEFNAKEIKTTTVKSKIFTSSDGVINRNLTPGKGPTESAVDLTVN